jgi:hypothetical protein
MIMKDGFGLLATGFKVRAGVARTLSHYALRITPRLRRG